MTRTLAAATTLGVHEGSLSRWLRLPQLAKVAALRQGREAGLALVMFICDRCEKPLTQAGALFFEPPRDGLCAKYHICVDCLDSFHEWRAAGKTPVQP